jgi:hypothetical protein
LTSSMKYSANAARSMYLRSKGSRRDNRMRKRLCKRCLIALDNGIQPCFFKLLALSRALSPQSRADGPNMAFAHATSDAACGNCSHIYAAELNVSALLVPIRFTRGDFCRTSDYAWQSKHVCHDDNSTRNYPDGRACANRSHWIQRRPYITSLTH